MVTVPTKRLLVGRSSLLKMPLGVRQLEWPARSACGAGLNPSLDSSPTESSVGAMRFFNSLLGNDDGPHHDAVLAFLLSNRPNVPNGPLPPTAN